LQSKESAQTSPICHLECRAQQTSQKLKQLIPSSLTLFFFFYFFNYLLIYSVRGNFS
jgi:hypothetical protein